MISGPIIAEVAALLGDPARATMTSALLDGRARTAGELALAARITPQTASTHLAKMTDAGLLSVLRSGRYRFFQLASPAVAEMIDGASGGWAVGQLWLFWVAPLIGALVAGWVYRACFEGE